MKKIFLSGKNGEGKYAIVDNDDFEKVSRLSWWYSKGYACHTQHIKVDDNGKQIQKTIWMHRLIAGTPDGLFTDHINTDRLDNRKSNLRVVTLAQNNCNLPLRKTNKSGFKGVYWDKTRSKWFAYIRHNKVMYALGRYDNKIDAALAYNRSAIKLHKEYARLNNV